MASKIGDLYWEVDASTSKFDKSLKTTDTKAKGLGSTFSTLSKGIIVGIGVAAVAGVAKLSKELITAASDAEETRNKFDVVYRDISQAAEDTAENLAENFGLSGTAARSLLADTGDLLTGFGFTQESALDLSDKVNQLAVDLASFTNFSGGAKGASDALTKALLGERESVKALGISILDADVKAKVLENTQNGITFETERQAKAFATLSIAQEQSKNAIGDFQNSINSYANQSRLAEAATDDLKVAMGERLLPVATNLKSVFAQLTRAMADNVAENNRFMEIFSDISDGALDGEASMSELLDTLEELSALNRRDRGEYDAQVIALADLIALRQDASRLVDQDAIMAEARENERQTRARLEEADVERLSSLKTDAFLALAQIKEDSLSDDEKELRSLREQINYWNDYRDTVEGAEELFQTLAQQRNDLQAKINAGLETEKEKIFGIYTGYVDLEDTIADAGSIAEAAARGRITLAQEEADRIQDLQNKYEQLASAGLGSLVAGVVDLSEQIKFNTASWEDFALVGRNAIAAVLDAMAQQLLAQAAVGLAGAFFSGGASLSGVGPALLGAGAASIAANALRGNLGFEQGGVVPSPPGVPATGDNMLARVNPGEVITPRDEAGGSNNYYFEFDGDILAHLVVDKRINKGRFSIDTARGLK